MVAAPAESVAPAPAGSADAQAGCVAAESLAASGSTEDSGLNSDEPRLPGSVDDVYQRCRDLGMRLSRQRRMVLDLLWAERDHLSARDIFEKLNDLGRNIGHTSVYQNLEALQSAGVIECLDRANGRLYGYRADPHSHLTCSETGAIQDLDVVLPEALVRQIEELTGFAIESYTLHLTGRPRR
ncbi:hypothetical protein IFHNHDMJ_01456 [Synechococcus sp. CBW1107]|nr:hypothetical protein IFHNHDMJ_01456 [Synechococcus sp. CBW1107]